MSTRWLAAVGAAFAVALCVAAPAWAAYEQVDTFAGTPGVLKAGDKSWPEEVQLGGTGGMAVNYTGAGGVPAGTIYAAIARESESNYRIARFNPDGTFSEAWVVTPGEQPYERCGPDGEAAHPVCPVPTRGGAGHIDVSVDETTGNVYVLSMSGMFDVGSSGTLVPNPQGRAVRIYSPDGSEVISRFAGPAAASGESTATSPEKIHTATGGLAVDAAGNAYVFDLNNFDNSYHRLMVFKPQSPGDYEHYVYAGQSHDLWAGFRQETQYPMNPLTDAAGDVYVAGDEHIAKLDPEQPAAPTLCEFKFPNGGIEGMTVNPLSGTVFFFTYKDKKVHQLKACDSEGKFAAAGTFALAPKRDEVDAMALDPVRQFEPSRSAGVLYAASPSGAGGPTAGTAGNTEGESALGYVFAPPRELAPEVLAESVSTITSSSARLEGTVNPKGSQTHYVFQYLSEAAYEANEAAERFAGAAEAPLGGGLLEGSAPLPIGDAISGLLPETEYRYRVLATSHCSSEDESKLCPGPGPARAFRTYPPEAPGLSDSRAFELVSPARKHGGQVVPVEPDVNSCDPFECKPGGAYNHEFPRQSSLDGDAIVYEGTPFAFDEGAKIENEYVSRRGAAGWQTVNLTPRALFSKTEGRGYQAFDPGLSEGLLGQFAPSLSPEAPAEYANLYRQPSADPASLNPLLSEANAFFHRLPGTGNGNLKLKYVGASKDLSRVFFEANDALTSEAGEAGEKTNLYEAAEGQLRQVNLAPGDAETLPGAMFGSGTLLKSGNQNSPSSLIAQAISADGSHAFWSSEAGQLYVRIDGTETVEVKAPGKFLVASNDGSRVLLHDGCLYGLQAEACEDLTQGKGGFEGISGQAEDLSHIYFLDSAVLTGEEENGEGAKAVAGKHNLYAWDEGTTTFIATLLDADRGSWAIPVENRSAEASPGGRWLAFVSRAPLSGYDNTGPCIVESGTENFHPGPCAEAFLYDSQSAGLLCASCPPSGAPPLGPSVLRRMLGAQPRYLLDSGRLYFDSQDALSQFDTNGKVEDVYQYEPNAVGSCKQAGGCVSLISAGRGGADSNLLATDPTGKNVFFTTRDHLNQPDQDEAIDLYDAREGGTPTVEPEALECQGEACQPPATPPNHPTPASSALAGDGNAEEKGPAHKHRKRHAKKKQAKKKAHKRAAKHNRGGVK
jgi:hypothetical protein